MKHLSLAAIVVLFSLPAPIRAQQPSAGAQVPKDAPGAERGSIVEDRAARRLLQAAEARMAQNEIEQGLEIYRNVVERYPRSRVRFDAHMKLGHHLLSRDRAFDSARGHFEAAAGEDNPNAEQRSEALTHAGICWYEARNYGKTFDAMRDVIHNFPTSTHANTAYYYIGLAHFQLGHYSRAIKAFANVGTALPDAKGKTEKAEAGKRLFIKIDDADLAALGEDQTVDVECQTTAGDKEKVTCYPLGRNVRVVLGSIETTLGEPAVGDGVLQLIGSDKVKVRYVDAQTADQKFNQDVIKEFTTVGNGRAGIMDGSYEDPLGGVVLGKEVHLRVIDPDADLTKAADQLSVVVEVYRDLTEEELEAEAAAKKAAEAAKAADPTKAATAPKPDGTPADGKPASDSSTVQPADRSTAAEDTRKLKLVDTVKLILTEARTDGGSGDVVHSGTFHGTVALAAADAPIADDPLLQALPGYTIRLKYFDQRNTGAGVREVTAEARAIEGSLGGVRVTEASISDEELKARTLLKTATALTNIGNRYKEFGLKAQARAKYQQALDACNDLITDARRLGGRFLEETYVQLWQIYFEMDELELAAQMCLSLQSEFPTSEFVDDALLKLGDVARKQKDHNRAIGIYTRLVNLKSSPLRGEGQFGIAECYEEQALAAAGTPAQAGLYDRSFAEYKRVFEEFPNSGRVGEAVAKMANYYYDQKDYARAVDVFETVMRNHPDAKFLDVILFNYGRCLYRMDRPADARKMFGQLIADFPDSPLAKDAKAIEAALREKGF
jgi:TolA-binding protein